MSSPTPLSWETVTIFISSTFNDMHAERDYLVKRVFPELREWCEQRKLRLVDIDLRWGVTEADATSKNTVKVCLSQIDKARPFFLCFLGQRRGWVPSRNEIDPETCKLFPDLKGYVGNASVTEMEVLHAVINPLNDSTRAEHAFFYHRDPSYLKDLPADPPFLRNTYTNEGIENPEARAKADTDLHGWLKETIPQTRRPLHQYSATWSPEQRTLELVLPLQCPSSLPENQERWRSMWREAGIEPRSLDLTEDPELGRQARAFNEQVAAGRLTNFRCGDEELAAVILRDLQSAIQERYPGRDVIPTETPLQKELDQQAQFLELNSTGFIERTGDFDALDRYIGSRSQDLFVLTAPAGMGKTMLLSNWIRKCQTRYGKNLPIYYRFIGASDGSTTVDAVLRSLLSEIKEAGHLSDEIPADPQELRNKLGDLLKSIGEQHPVLLVIDALNQLESGLADTTWILRKLPNRVKLVVSFKREGDEAERLAAQFRDVIPETCAEVTPFDSLEDRLKLVEAYLDQYLKQLDDAHVQALITSQGAENPLFLKVVLSELRVFGSFGNLGQKIQNDFGTTPKSAFDAVLRRLETDPAFTAITFTEAVPLLFGLLSHARVGLSEQELMSLFDQEHCGTSNDARQETIRLLLRQVRPFTATRDGRFDFFYDSFRLAALAQYEGQDRQRGQRSPRDWHRSLARYFESLPAWVAQDEMHPTLRRAAELPYHLAWACMADHLAELMLEDDLLETVVYGLGPYEAIRDLEFAVTPPVSPSKKLPIEQMEAVTSLQGALRLSQHVLAPDPAQLPSQFHGRLLESGNPAIQRILEELRVRTRRPWLRPVTASLTVPGGPLIRTLVGHTDAVEAVAVTPDGRAIVSGSHDGTVKVWDLASGRELRTLAGHADRVTALAVTPDGKSIVSGSHDGTVKVWDLATGQKLRTLEGHTGEVRAVAVTLDGKTIVSGSSDKTVKVWDLATGQELRTLVGHTGEVRAVAVTLDGRTIVSGDGGFLMPGTLKVWDLATGQELRTLVGHTSSVNAVAVTPDGQSIVSGSGAHVYRISSDNSVKVWDLASGQELRSLEGHTDLVMAVAVTPDGTTIVSGSLDKTLKVWDLETGRELRTLEGHTSFIAAVAVTPDGRTIVSGSWDKTVKVWDLATGQKLRSLEGHTDRVTSVAVTPDGTTIVTGSWDKTVKVWDLATGQELRTLEGHLKGVDAAGVTPDGKTIFSGSRHNGIVKVWDLATGREMPTLAGYTMAVTPDGKTIVSGSFNQTVKVWDLATGRELRTLRGHTFGVNAVAVTPDGKTIVSGSSDNTVKVWDLESGRGVHTLAGHTDGVFAVAVTPDGTTIVSGSSDRTVKVWDLATGQELRTLEGHTSFIAAVAVTPDGTTIVSAGSWDKTVKVWDLETGKELRTLEGHTGDIEAVAITPDGKTIVSGSDDKTVKVWDLESGELIAGFSVEGVVLACATTGPPAIIIVGDVGGVIHILRLENVPCGPRIVTAQRYTEGGELSVTCPYCNARRKVQNAELGTVVTCSSCSRQLRLNPFMVWIPKGGA